MDVANEFLKNPNNFENKSAHVRKRMICSDGFTMSVQANEFVRCNPKDNYWPFNSVEVRNPSSEEELLLDFRDDKEKPTTENAYGYVPIEVIVKIIEKHGGIKRI